MSGPEAREPDLCADCGAEVSALDRSYAVSDETDLCFACALRRGAQWDEAHDLWLRAPQVADLAARE